MPYPGHIFIDNSNLWGGAQNAAYVAEGAPWLAVRIYWKNFFQLIEQSYLCETRVIVGSRPPANENLWEIARSFGYDVTLLDRVPASLGYSREQAVDELVHLKILECLLDNDPPRVLVLVTGDGRVSDFGSSFVDQVRRAIRRGWSVNIISWQETLHDDYVRLCAAYPDRVHVDFLDKFYSNIVFLRDLDFKHPDGRVQHIAFRPAQALKSADSV
jgi:hypothetical protein